MDILQIENLTFRYPKTEQNALENIDLQVRKGEFLLLCGQSGCGKTTLLKLLKRELAPAGEKSGRILYDGVLQEALDARRSASEIGFVLQDPDSQIVTDKVWHELSFGLENLGVPTSVIRRRVGEMASYFGIQDWFRKRTDALSGGQKQMLNLASVMVMQPKVLILDEPTGQLDPIAASEFIATLKKLNRELGVTILLAEHRLEEVFPVADRVLLMDKGRALLLDTPRAFGKRLREISPDHPMLSGLPAAVRIFHALGVRDDCPLTVREGRDFLERHFTASKADLSVPQNTDTNGGVAAELRDVWFRYEKNAPDILRGVSLQIFKGELFCLLGGNGVGKTTLLNVLSGLDAPYRGKVFEDGKPLKSYKGNALYRNRLALLPQNPQTVFLKDSVKADFQELLETLDVPKAQRAEEIRKSADELGVAPLLDRHPYDLSGGEQQKCALAKMLLLHPQILLLDEPTKGLDTASKAELRTIFKRLTKSRGMTLVLVTHDVEFAAENADRCALLFDGEIVSCEPPSAFFAENSFYTTAASRMARELYPHAVTCADVVACCIKNREKQP